MNHILWKAIIWIFTVVLLFGSPIQFLWVPKVADPIFDALYTVTAVVFILDMIFHFIADPEYFGFTLVDEMRRRRRRIGGGGGTTTSSIASGRNVYHPTLWTCGIGSFKFWCDVVSTIAIFQDISYINPKEYEMAVISLTLNKYGLPVRNKLGTNGSKN